MPKNSYLYYSYLFSLALVQDQKYEALSQNQTHLQ